MTGRPHDDFERLLRAARDDVPEPVDVAARVMVQIRSQADAGVTTTAAAPRLGWLARCGIDPSLLAAAGVSAGMAVIAAVVALPYLDALFEPMLDLMQGTEDLLR